MVKKAVAHIKSKGQKTALRDLCDPHGGFVNGEFYVAVNRTNGLCVAHGVKPHLVGQIHLDLRDADGKFFVREYIDIATKQGRGWLDFRWQNPVTGRVQEKSGDVELVDDLVVSCGIYNVEKDEDTARASDNARPVPMNKKQLLQRT